MNLLRAKETLTLPSGKVFEKGRIYYGRIEYYFNTDLKRNEETISNLVVIYDKDQTWLVQKDTFQQIYSK